MGDVTAYETSSLDWAALRALAQRAAQETALKPDPRIVYFDRKTGANIDVLGPHWVLDRRYENYDERPNDAVIEEGHVDVIYALIADGQLMYVRVAEEARVYPGGPPPTYTDSHTARPMDESDVQVFDFASKRYNHGHGTDHNIWGDVDRPYDRGDLLHDAKGAGLLALLEAVRTGQANLPAGLTKFHTPKPASAPHGATAQPSTAASPAGNLPPVTDDVLIRAVGATVTAQLDAAMRQRITNEPAVREIIDDMYANHRGPTIDGDPALIEQFIGIFERARSTTNANPTPPTIIDDRPTSNVGNLGERVRHGGNATPPRSPLRIAAIVVGVVAVAVVAGMLLMSMLNGHGGSATTTREVVDRPTADRAAVDNVLRTMAVGSCWNGIWSWNAGAGSYMPLTVPDVVDCSGKGATQRLTQVADNCRGTAAQMDITLRATFDELAHCLELVPAEGMCLPFRVNGDQGNFGSWPVVCDTPPSPDNESLLRLAERLPRESASCDSDRGRYYLWFSAVDVGFCYEILGPR